VGVIANGVSPLVDAVSDPFTITGSINVTWPASGIGGIMPGSTHDITWNSEGAGPTVSIFLSTNGGGSWIALSGSAPNHDGQNTWSWTVNAANSSYCFIAVISNSVSLIGGDGPFTIGGGTLAVTYPVSGDSNTLGCACDITWNSQGLGSSVVIYLTTDGGNTWSLVNGLAPNHDGSNTYHWPTPSVSSSNCYLTIFSSDYLIFDVAGPFTLRRH
jgi:hypothetical protein